MKDVFSTCTHSCLSVQNSTYAAIAAGIMAVEAGHAAIIRNQLYNVRLFYQNVQMALHDSLSSMTKQIEMRKTDCFGKTRLVSHVPSSS